MFEPTYQDAEQQYDWWRHISGPRSSVHKLLERLITSEYGTPIIKRPHTLAKSRKVGLMHCNDGGRSRRVSPLYSLHQVAGNWDLKERWGSADHDDPGHDLEVEFG